MMGIHFHDDLTAVVGPRLSLWARLKVWLAKRFRPTVTPPLQFEWIDERTVRVVSCQPEGRVSKCNVLVAHHSAKSPLAESDFDYPRSRAEVKFVCLPPDLIDALAAANENREQPEVER